MDDTSDAMAEKMRALIRLKTPQERFMMRCSMYAASKILVTRAILEENPSITGTQLKQELFLKFYGDDFTPEEKAKILAHFQNLALSSAGNHL